MSRPVSRLSIIGSIVKKDVKEFSRDRLWLFLSLFVLIVMIVVFWVLPDNVDESIPVGLTGLGDPAALVGLEAIEDEGLRLVAFDSAEDLRLVVAGDARAWQSDGQTVVIPDGSDAAEPEGAEKVSLAIGLAFPDDFLAATAAGQQTTVEVFVDARAPEELKTAMSSLVKELGYAVAGSQLPVDTARPEAIYTVLGEDRAGNQVTPRESFRPILVFLVLLMEMFVMSSLIAREMQSRTVTALLVTPATIGDVLAAKGISGAVMGLGQAVILLAAINVVGPSTAPDPDADALRSGHGVGGSHDCRVDREGLPEHALLRNRFHDSADDPRLYGAVSRHGLRLDSGSAVVSVGAGPGQGGDLRRRLD